MAKSDGPPTNSAQPVFLLRCRVTQRYVAAQTWTDDLSLADKFTNELDAARAIVLNDLHNVDIVLAALDTDTEFLRKPIR